ncbi:hypothetical protein Ddye_011342 [Dipteronia dyeriana]|uniref:Exocyst complex component SEC5 n=1 Tax=Dipteronia dyeriana TaxID=168575 RepID=A0AAD9X2C9_9ROSI|nr:hypothetical protein Ddye_011342 [Dipteronia dyeriana]
MAPTPCSVCLSLMFDGGWVCSCALFEALSRVHQDTSGVDLELGALGLKSDLKGQIQQRKQLVKDNFDCFATCKTTIDGILVYIESKLKRIEDDPGGSGTYHLFNMMQ